MPSNHTARRVQAVCVLHVALESLERARTIRMSVGADFFVVVCVLSLSSQTIADENCTQFLHGNNQSFTKGGTHATGVEFNSGLVPGVACPPWYRLGGDGRCHSGNTLDGVVEFQEVTGRTRLQGLYCMTTHGNSVNRTDEVGGCLFSLIYHSANLPTHCLVFEHGHVWKME